MICRHGQLLFKRKSSFHNHIIVMEIILVSNYVIDFLPSMDERIINTLSEYVLLNINIKVNNIYIL